VLSRKAANTSFTLFGLTRNGVEGTFYCTWGENTYNHGCVPFGLS